MILSRKERKRDFHLLVFTGLRYNKVESEGGNIEGHRQTGIDREKMTNEMCILRGDKWDGVGEKDWVDRGWIRNELGVWTTVV